MKPIKKKTVQMLRNIDYLILLFFMVIQFVGLFYLSFYLLVKYQMIGAILAAFVIINYRFKHPTSRVITYEEEDLQ